MAVLGYKRAIISSLLLGTLVSVSVLAIEKPSNEFAEDLVDAQLYFHLDRTGGTVTKAICPAHVVPNESNCTVDPQKLNIDVIRDAYQDGVTQDLNENDRLLNDAILRERERSPEVIKVNADLTTAQLNEPVLANQLTLKQNELNSANGHLTQVKKDILDLNSELSRVYTQLADPSVSGELRKALIERRNALEPELAELNNKSLPAAEESAATASDQFNSVNSLLKNCRTEIQVLQNKLTSLMNSLSVDNSEIQTLKAKKQLLANLSANGIDKLLPFLSDNGVVFPTQNLSTELAEVYSRFVNAFLLSFPNSDVGKFYAYFPEVGAMRKYGNGISVKTVLRDSHFIRLFIKGVKGLWDGATQGNVLCKPGTGGDAPSCTIVVSGDKVSTIQSNGYASYFPSIMGGWFGDLRCSLSGETKDAMEILEINPTPSLLKISLRKPITLTFEKAFTRLYCISGNSRCYCDSDMRKHDKYCADYTCNQMGTHDSYKTELLNAATTSLEYKAAP